MSTERSKQRRERVEPGIYRRSGADGRPLFEIGWRDSQGRQRWRRVQGGVKTARAALAEAHASRARGERVTADPRLKFEEAVGAWWEGRALKLKETTQATYAAALKHLQPAFQGWRLHDITPADVAKFISRQQQAGLKSWTTIKGQLTVLRSVFTFAARHLGFVGTNPVALLDRIERPGMGDERPKRILRTDELIRLLAAVDVGYRLIFELAAETGARLGEVLGLVWGDVDTAGETVTINHQLDRKGQRVELKTKRSRRCLEITPALAVKLREHKMASSRSGRHDLVFCTRAGTPHDHRNIGGRVLARAVQRVGLEKVMRDGQLVEAAPTFHSLRHSHGSALIASGWDIEEVSARLGHSDVGTTQRVYVHAYDAARRSAARRNRLVELYGSGSVSTDPLPTVRG